MPDTPTEQVIEMLWREGFDVMLFLPVRGYWRRQDVHRWEAQAIRREDGRRVRLVSWRTVTDCAKAVRLNVDEETDQLFFDVSPIP